MSNRILFKLWQFPRLSETFLVAQIISAIKCGYEVNILVEELPKENLQHKQLLFEYGLLEKVILEDYKIPKNKIWRILKAFFLIIHNTFNFFKLKAFINGQNRFEIRFIYMFQFYKNLRHYDIIHVQYGTNGKPLDLLKKIDFFPPKIIVSFHGHDVYFPINGIINDKGYYEMLFKYSDILVVNTQYLKDVIVALDAPKDKIHIIPVGVDTKYFKPLKLKTKAKDVFRIITVGRLEIFKGQKLGLQVIKKLKDIGFQVQYTLVGAGSQEEILKKLILDYDLKDEVIFLGKKPQSAIRDLLQNHDLFLMTSVTDPNYGVESQGLVTAEAQACGLPIVAFDSGGVKYTIANGISGFIVTEYDVNTMASKVGIMINNVELRSKMSVAAQEYIDKYFAQVLINNVWCKTYKTLLD